MAFGSSVLPHKKEQQIKIEGEFKPTVDCDKWSAVGLLLFYKEKSEENKNMKNYKIAVAGTGYVGLSLSVLLAQHNQVMAVDIVQAKVDMINNHKSPIQDDYIEKYLAEKELNLTATLDAKAAYSDADFVVIAAPTNVYLKLSVAA